MADIVSIPGLAERDRGAVTQKDIGQYSADDAVEWVKSSSFARSDNYIKAASEFILNTLIILTNEKGRLLRLTQNYVRQEKNYQKFKDQNNLTLDPDY